MDYYDNINDAPVSNLFRQASIKTENKLMYFSDSSWKDCIYTGISTGTYLIFYHGGWIEHGTHVTGPVDQSSAESEYNAACTEGMALAHFRMLIHGLLNKNTDIVSEEAPLIILDSTSTVCMANNGNDTKHTRHIASKMHFGRNGENCKMHIIGWCEGGLQLAHIAIKNVGEHDLTPKMRYIMVRLDKWERTILQ